MAVIGQTIDDPSRVRQLAVDSNDFVNAFRGAAVQSLFPESIHPEDINEVKALSTFSSMRDDMFESLPLFWPNFYLLNVVRNGVQVVASRLKHKHISQAGDFRTHCIAWAHSVDIIRWFGKRPELKERFFLVRHEQLLESDSCDDVFARIQHRFGLDRSEECADFVRSNYVSQNTEVESSASPQTEEGIKSRMNAWRTWTQSQRDEFEDVCGKAMNELGYEIPW